MLRSRFLILLILLPVSRASGQAPGDTLQLTLRSAVEMALLDSPEVAIDAAGEQFARARLAQARAARFLTSATATTAHAIAPGLDIPDSAPADRTALYLDPALRNDWANPRPYNQVEVELLQPLYTWGELRGQIRAAAAAVELEEAQRVATTEEVARRTAELVVGLAVANQLVQLAEDAETVLEDARRELSRLLDEGSPDVTDADLFQLRIFEQELARQRVEIVETRAIAAAGLGRQLGVPGAALDIPAAERLDPSVLRLDELQAVATRHRSEMRQAAAGELARSAQVDVARSDYFPKLFAGATASGRYVVGREHQPNPYIVDPYLGGGIRAGLGVRQNLAFGQTRARVMQAEAQLNEVRHQRFAAEQLILFEVEEAFRRLRIAEAGLAARQEAMAIAAEWLRTEQINFDLGLGEVGDLVAAARADLEARFAAAQALRDQNLAVLRLYASTGTLSTSILDGTLFD